MKKSGILVILVAIVMIVVGWTCQKLFGDPKKGW